MAFYQWKFSIGNGILPVEIFHGNDILPVEIIAFIIHLENWIVSAT